MKEDTLFAYMNMDAAYQPKAIPGHDTFTFMSKKSGMPQIWTLNESDEPILYASFDDSVLNVYHSPDGKMSVVGKANNGNEKEQFYLLTEGGKKTEKLVESLEHFHHFGGWSPDGASIAYSSNRRGPGYFDIFIMHIKTREITKVYEGETYCKPLMWLRDGQHLLIDVPKDSVDQNILSLNVITGDISKFGTEEEARFKSFALKKDGKGGYVLTDLGEETLYISQFSFENRSKFKKIRHIPKWDIEEIKLSPDEKSIVYTVNEGGISGLFILDLVTQEEKEIKQVPRGDINSISWLNHDQFVCAVSTPTCPGDIWRYTFHNDQAERITFISQSEELEALFIEPELCHFESFDGLKVPYFYYAKDDQKNKPAVLYIHGGPSSQTRAAFNPLFQYLAAQGYAVAAPNIRGSTGYGRTYESLDDVRKRMDAVKDIVWLVKDLIHTHQVNPDRVGIMGRSYGGFMVLSAISHYPEMWSAAVDIVGISNLNTFMQTTGEWRRELRGTEYGTVERDGEFFEQIAPLRRAHSIKTPLLVFHGLNDTRVPVSESIQMVMAMKERGQDVDLIIYNDEGHMSERKQNHIDLHRKVVDLLNKTLK